MSEDLKDPASLLPFSRDIIILPDDIIPKNPLTNELSLSGTLKQIKTLKKPLLFIE